MTRLDQLRWDNSYARLHPAFYEVVDPTPLPDPYLVSFNPAAAELLELDPSTESDPELAAYLCGNRRIPGAEPIAQAYAGHQFGVWVPQLGDGRAFLLGEARNSRGEQWDLHLKGAGRTRFSRFGDGRSVLRSVVREYLASEALFGLGIPTTRALSIVGSDLAVQRERVETAATLLRLAPNHVRFGTFEYFAARGETDRVRELTRYVIARHFESLAATREPLAWFGEVCRRTGRLLAHWMAAGFAHGVMNTDNMSVLGVTLDYGPYGFLEAYDPGFICNHSDTEGRYAFDRQPSVAMWNCARLGDALMGAADAGELRDGTEQRCDPEAWQAELESYWPAYVERYQALMQEKLGLREDAGDDGQLLADLLELLRTERRDYARFFRSLSGYASEAGSSTFDGSATPGLQAWLARYAVRLRREGSVDAERSARMRLVNPKYVLRNWVAQEAVAAAEAKEFGVIERLRSLFADPYSEHPGMDRFAEPQPEHTPAIVVSCSS